MGVGLQERGVSRRPCTLYSYSLLVLFTLYRVTRYKALVIFYFTFSSTASLLRFNRAAVES